MVASRETGTRRATEVSVVLMHPEAEQASGLFHRVTNFD